MFFFETRFPSLTRPKKKTAVITFAKDGKTISFIQGDGHFAPDPPIYQDDQMSIQLVAALKERDTIEPDYIIINASK